MTTTTPSPLALPEQATRTAQRMLAGPSGLTPLAERRAQVSATGFSSRRTQSRRYAVSSTVSVPCVTTQPATSSLRRVSRICPARLNMSAGVI